MKIPLSRLSRLLNTRVLGTTLLFCSALNAQPEAPELKEMPAGAPALLTEPYLQLPEKDSIHVVWMTNFPGIRNELIYGEGRDRRRARAETQRVERLFEDESSRSPAVANLDLTEVVNRPVWRHEAVATGLAPGRRLPYRIRSIAATGEVFISDSFTLQPLPEEGQPLRILLASDQQNRYGYPAAMQRIEQAIGKLDAVFFSGDYVDQPRRGSEWFDRFDPAWADNPNPEGRPFPSTRPPFFPSMQGTFQRLFPEFPAAGGQILQHTPIMGAIGNHEVPGRHRPNASYLQNGEMRIANLGSMDSDPQPRWFAQMRYEELQDTVNPAGDPAVREQWIRDNSHDFEVHRALWNHPEGPEGESYWAQKFGDVFVVSMNVARIWRTWNVRPQDRGKFTEIVGEDPAEWGFGDFHFYPFGPGSTQYDWLRSVLESEEFRNTKYRVVMAHHTVSGLGDNAAPVHADNVMYVEYVDEAGVEQSKEVRFPTFTTGRIATYQSEVEPLLDRITRIRYEYPITEDIWLNDIEPLLKEAGVQLVHIGHSHLWNRTHALGAPSVNYLEASNPGNTFGAFWTQADGEPWNGRARGFGGLFAEDSPWILENYPRQDDPHGRPALFPSLMNPMQVFGGEPNPVPFVADNNISTFSILDTGLGAVRSFALDLTDPEAELVEFDRFELLNEP